MIGEHQSQVLPECPTANVRFDYLDGLTIQVRPAFVDVNPLYDAAARAWIAPLELAAQLPDGHPRKLSEKHALENLVKVYAAGVICGCSDEEMDTWGPVQWEAWLLEHVEELHSLRDAAESRPVFGLGPEAPR